MTEQSFSRLSPYARWLLKRRWLVVAVAALVAAISGYRTVRTYAALRSDLEELLPVGAPSVAALSSLRARLPGIRHLGVVVAIDRPEAKQKATEFLDALAARVREYPRQLVADVRVDTRAERAFAETYALQLMDPEDVRKLREAVERRRDWDVSRGLGIDLEDEDAEAKPEVPLTELRSKYEARFGKPSESPDGRLISSDGKTAVLLVRTAGHDTSQHTDFELMRRVKSDVAALGFSALERSGLRIGYAGDVAARVEEARGLEADLALSSAVVLLLVAGSIVWFYRSFRALPILGLPLLAGTAAAFGMVALPPLSILYLNSNTAFLGSIVIGNGVNSGIILLARFLEERQLGVSLELAVDRSISSTWKATLAAAFAAAAAYGSLVFTDFRGFNQFGWIGGIGLLTCWVANYTLVPTLAFLMGASLGGADRGVRAAARPGLLTRLSLDFPRAVVGIGAVLGLIALVGLYRRSNDWIEYDLSTLRRRDSWDNGERYWGKRMDAALGRYLTPTVVLAGNPSEARLIESRVRELADGGHAGGLIGTVRSASLFFPQGREQSLEEARHLKALLTPRLLADLEPRDRALIDKALSPQSLQPLTPNQIPDTLLIGLRERDGRIDRNVLVFPKLTSRTWNAELLESYSHDLRHAATIENDARPVAGSLLLSSDIARAMNLDGPRATRLSLIAVLAICWFAFRAHGQSGLRRYTPDRASIGYSIAAVASLFVGVLLMMGVLAWSGQRINFSNFVALPITFGVAADYAINVLRRYQADDGRSLGDALANTSGAIALCSATTVIGFGSLLMAKNRALFSFGVFATAGEITCLVTAIIVLPAALTLWERRAPVDRAEHSGVEAGAH